MKKILMISSALAALSTPAFGQEDVIMLDEVVVSGGLNPAPKAALGASVSVVTADDLEREGVVYAVDALEGLPGVSVSKTGGNGGNAVVRIRGAEAAHTQVFIDGVKVTTPDNLEYDFSSLLAADIEQIEVLRGPQSALFGANTIGGVVSITTKRARTPGVSFSGSTETGWDETYRGDAAARYRGETYGLSLSVAGQRVGGYDISDLSGGKDDEDENLTINLNGDLDITEDLRLGGGFRFVDKHSDYDKFNFAAADHDGLVTDADLRSKRQEIFGSAFGEADLMDGRAQSRLSLSAVDFDDGQYEDGEKTTATSATRQTARFQTTVALDAPTIAAADHTLTGAVDYERETFHNTDADLVFDPSQLDKQKRNQWSTALEYRGEFMDQLNLQLGLRRDINDKFRDFTSWSAAVSWYLPTDLRLHASAGRSSQNPSMIDQFGFFPDSFTGNPDVKPEKSIGWDFGVEQSFFGGRGVIDVTYFYSRLSNEIGTEFDPATFISTSVNEDGRSKRQGVEITGSFDILSNFTLGANYTFLDAKNSDKSREVRREKHNFGLSADLRLFENRARLSADLDYRSGLYDSDFTAPYTAGRLTKLDNRWLAGISASYKVTDQVEVFGRISNLFDEDYEDVDGYAAQGRVGFIGLRARW